MRIAYATSYNAQDIHVWSGTALHIAKSLEAQNCVINYIGPLRKDHQLRLKIKQQSYRLLARKTYLRDRSPLRLRSYAMQIERKLQSQDVDCVFSPGTTDIAFVDCKQPIVFWTDATFAGMVNFYETFSNLSSETIIEGHAAERSALERCHLALYSSEWAAKTAIEFYKADSSKIKVVPFGANLESEHTLDEIRHLITSRPKSTCQLLFLGVDWVRKGGPLALAVATRLKAMGIETRLTVVGCIPPNPQQLPGFVEVLGFISKRSPEGLRKIKSLLATSHFMILPSVAECTPIAFSEANSFGLPCISTKIGGIPSIIRDGVNGKTFSITEGPETYCQFIGSMFEHYTDYYDLALSAFREYQVRLNWKTAGETVKALIRQVL